MNECPCNGCTDRTSSCHSPGRCTKSPSYEDWVKTLPKSKPKEYTAKDFLIDNVIKRKRKAK